MKTKLMLWAILGLSLVFYIGCGDEDDDGDNKKPGDSDPVEEDSETEVDSDSEVEEVDTYTGDPVTAIEEDFENYEAGGREFYMSNPPYDDGGAFAFEDNGTVAEVGGQNCLMIHDYAKDNNSYGFAVEFQLALDGAPVDMSHEDFTISFQIYVPQEVCDLGANVQFGFYETTDYNPIYSAWSYIGGETYGCDEWSTITAKIDTISGAFDYSGFDNDPDDWQLDVVRIQTIVNGENAAEDDEIWYCVDNIVVKNFE